MPIGNRSLLDPRLTSQIQEEWSSRCTIQSVVSPASSTQLSGQRFPALSYANVLGMVNIPCRIAPDQRISPTDTEKRTMETIEGVLKRTVKLNGYYPTIKARANRAVVDGTAYLIRGVEHDSERYSTRLQVEIVTPQKEGSLP